MTDLDSLWNRLTAVQQLHFEARSLSATGWNGIGEGKVDVTTPEADVIVFDESGEWAPAGRTVLRFFNVFRWTKSGERLRLEHLRFGPERPVFLFEMALDGDGTWREVAPHQCARDCYAATLMIVDDELRMAWTVTGPDRREEIRYRYW